METVLHDRLPFAPWADPRTRKMPGILPLDEADWLRVDEAYAGQMRLRDQLIASRLSEVHACLPEAQPAARELHQKVLRHLPGLGFARQAGGWARPDGVAVPDGDPPLVALGRLLQNDFCLMQEGEGGEYRLTGAILCFPAGWTLSEKIGRPMGPIHGPVAKYTEDIAARVNRLFTAIRPEAPLWRANAHESRAPLFYPLPEAEPKDRSHEQMEWIRSERQCLLRLPESRAVVFSIHTYLVPIAKLTEVQAAALREFPIHRSA